VSPTSIQPDAQAKSLSAVKSPVLSTLAMEAVTPLRVSLDGVLLFIGDTNIFPMLSFENILATAAKEIEHMASTVAKDASKNIGESRPGTKQDELSTRTTAGLDADGFVRVCIHLLRDNFLVKEMGFQHRVEALTVEQRDKEWAQRLPGATEHCDLLARLKGWMEHY
ncbi:unnamed protein product, partial [Ectocarpus sp. 12 AP-2014]